MKILVVYYSRTNCTRLAARMIAKTIHADSEEITDSEKRSGPIGFIRCGYEAVLDKLTRIGEIESDIESYDLIVLGTPVWAGKPATPVTTFVKKHGYKFKNMALFVTYADLGTSFLNVAGFLEKAAGKEAIRTLPILSSKIKRADYSDVIDFANQLNKL